MFLRRFLAIGLIILLGCSTLSAFLITKHIDVTETGLGLLEDSLSPTLLQGHHFTNEAKRQIVSANISKDTGDCSHSPLGGVDNTPAIACGYFGGVERSTDDTFLWNELGAGIASAELTNPPDHFDDELFSQGNLQIKIARDAAVADLKSGYYTGARKQVGFALHTIQDFYAHTNWIDLGLGCCLSRLGFADAFSNQRLAGQTDATCTDPSTLLSDLPENKNRLGLPNILTSGYFPNSKSEIARYHKCQHGEPIGIGRGINKDSAVLNLDLPGTTEYARFNSALNVAAGHTNVFINGILTEGCGTNPVCFQGFMGYPTITSIDPTGSDVGHDLFYLHVLGTGFTEDEAKSHPTVLWNDKPLETAPMDLTGGTRLDARIEKAYLDRPGPVKITVKQFEIESNGNVTTDVLLSNAVNFTITGPELDCPGAIRPHRHDPRYMDVNANRWNDTGYLVTAGQRLNLEVVPGFVVWRAGGLLTGATGEAQPQGDTRANPMTTLLWIDPQMPIGVAPIGALIGMVVDTQHLDAGGKPTIPLTEKPDGVKYFRILTGGQFAQPVPETGRLYLGINDGAFYNNGGCFQVRFITPPK